MGKTKQNNIKKKFFARPPEEIHRQEIHGSETQRGLLRWGKGQGRRRKKGWKEGWTWQEDDAEKYSL